MMTADTTRRGATLSSDGQVVCIREFGNLRECQKSTRLPSRQAARLHPLPRVRRRRCGSGFHSRPPSGFVWAWFKPDAVPSGLLLRFPDQRHGGSQAAGALTLRQLLQAAGIDPLDVSLWYLYGVACDPRAAGAAQLDLPLGEPPPGADPNIVVFVGGPASSNNQAPGAPQFFPSPRADVAHVYDEIDADWNVTLQLEKQLILAQAALEHAGPPGHVGPGFKSR